MVLYQHGLVYIISANNSIAFLSLSLKDNLASLIPATSAPLPLSYIFNKSKIYNFINYSGKKENLKTRVFTVETCCVVRFEYCEKLATVRN